MNKIAIIIFIFCSFNISESADRDNVNHEPLFDLIISKGLGFTLYLNNKNDRMKVEKCMFEEAGVDYIFYPISGNVIERVGDIGFFVSGKGAVFIQLAETKHLIFFDTKLNKISLFKCLPDQKNVQILKKVREDKK